LRGFRNRTESQTANVERILVRLKIMSAPCFCHLHTHTQYSLLDGASRLRDIIQRARKMKQPALAITDHGNMFGAIEFYKECAEASKNSEKDGLPPITPILGIET
jgi:DNA polymerase III subunit alpha